MRFTPIRDLAPTATAFEPSRAVLVHDEVSEWFESAPGDPYRRRANLAIQHLAAFGRTNVVKTVRGSNRGWRRAPLGGQGGYHYYLWWAPSDAPPVRDLDTPSGTILVRKVRHHDETDQLLEAGDVGRQYRPAEPLRLVFDDSMGAAYTTEQTQYARLPQPVRQFRGHPGSGKTTTLWLSALWVDAADVLYLTRHRGLADSSREYLRTFAPRGTSVRVETLDGLLSTILGSAHAPQALNHYRDRFRRLPLYEDTGAWRGKTGLLYDELYAHAFGRALPFEFRGLRADGVVVDPDAYAAARAPVLGEDAAERAATVIRTLANRDTDWLDLFPQPVTARRALDALTEGGLPDTIADVGAIFVDEIQDLTPVEYLLILRIAAMLGERAGTRPAVAVAGDEGQVVTPSAFDWGEFGEVADRELSGSQAHVLPQNVRSPYAIAQVVNNTWGLYRSVSKRTRPTGYARARREYHTAAHVMYANCDTTEELGRLVSHIAALPGAAVVYPGYEIPREYAAFADALMLPEDIKGLERQTVAVVDPGAHIAGVGSGAQGGQLNGPEELWAKLLVDRLRVCLSRATEDLLLIDNQADVATGDGVRALCRDVPGFHETTPDELEAFLAHHRYDAEELVQRYLSDAHSFVQSDQWATASRTAGRAVDLLGDPEDPGSVQDGSLRRETHTAASEIAFRTACAQGLRPDDDVLLREAEDGFGLAGEDASVEVVRLFRARLAASEDDPDPADMARLGNLLPDAVPGLRPLAEGAISQWLDDIPALDDAVPRPARTQLIAAIYGLATGPSAGVYSSDERVTRALEPAFGADALQDILTTRDTLRDAEALLSSEIQARERAEFDLEATRADMAATQADLEGERVRIREVEQLWADAEKATEAAKAELEQARQRVADVEDNVTEMLEERGFREQELLTVQGELDEAEGERDEHAGRIAELEAEGEGLRERVQQVGGDTRKALEERAARRKLDASLAEAVVAREDAEKRARALEFEAERLRDERLELGEATDRAADLDALLALAEEEREDAVRGRAKAEKRVVAIQQERDRLREQLEAATVENAALAQAAAAIPVAAQAEPVQGPSGCLGRLGLLALAFIAAVAAALA
ncbi:hypothetical protein HN371_05595 [Candidatus Poribacteria bacterium]|nr:hypothetical protein [Candidatus Poribacteria bacterium]MBT5531948.1 hypothetical protein [Candidatus Poribacteria bacterium]MBT7100926.1 hypothetical protein [Candidatus Poribacteria bacterium]MBT7805373.1 hypothetical protein [Candidatus Poribacteria bacterium]